MKYGRRDVGCPGAVELFVFTGGGGEDNGVDPASFKKVLPCREANDRKAKSCETLSICFLYKVILLEDPALCMENLHAMGPFHYWQRPCSAVSPLNSLSGCVESGRVAFCNWQRSHSASSPLDSSSGRVKEQ